MDAKQSPLKFLEFTVIDSHFETIDPEPNEKCNFNELPIEVDFETFINNENPEIFQIGLILNGNTSETPKPGYKFSIIANGLFELEKSDNIEESKVSQFMYFSALPMVISAVRNYFLNLSSYAPYGKYLLPAIDLPDLVDKKISEINNENKYE